MNIYELSESYKNREFNLKTFWELVYTKSILLIPYTDRFLKRSDKDAIRYTELVKIQIMNNMLLWNILYDSRVLSIILKDYVDIYLNETKITVPGILNSSYNFMCLIDFYKLSNIHNKSLIIVKTNYIVENPYTLEDVISVMKDDIKVFDNRLNEDIIALINIWGNNSYSSPRMILIH